MILAAIRLSAPLLLLGILAARSAISDVSPQVAAPSLIMIMAMHDDAVLPDTPLGRCARDFIATVNDGSPDAVRKFETTWASKARLGSTSIEDRIPRFAGLRADWGRITLARIVSSTPDALVIGVTLSNDAAGDFEFRFDPAEPNKITGVNVEIARGSQRSQPLTPAARSDAIEAACKALQDSYVFPKVADKMAASVLSKLKSGGYDAVTDERALARALTDDFRAISKDKHLGVRLAPAEDNASSAAKEKENAPPPDMRDMMRRENYAFKKVEILPGNIGYLRFDAFVEDEQAYATGAAAFAFLKNCGALIVDLRSNGGGSPESIAFLTTYLFDKRTHLNDMIDRSGNVVEEFWTLDQVPGDRLPADLPVFVLTSKETFSGAEEFSYNLKNLKRATIIGETTGGGAHPVRAERLNGRFMIRVPYMRANNPISKTNWEGTGVEPDIKTPASEALDRAQSEARAAIAVRTTKKP